MSPESDSTDAKVQVALRLSPDLLERLDARRGLSGMSRNEWITRMVEFTLEFLPYDPDVVLSSHKNAAVKIKQEGP